MKAKIVGGVLLAVACLCLLAVEGTSQPNPPTLPSVPGPDAPPPPLRPGRAAKEKLETLKKRLPYVVSSWAKERWYDNCTVEVRVVRMLGPTEAKVVLMSRWADPKGRPDPPKDTVFTIFLDFYEGVWSTTRSDAWSLTD